MRAPTFQINLRTSLSLKVAAFWRRTISLKWGWRHLPGVPVPSEGVPAAGVVLGVEGTEGKAICRRRGEGSKQRNRKLERVSEEGQRRWDKRLNSPLRRKEDHLPGGAGVEGIRSSTRALPWPEGRSREHQECFGRRSRAETAETDAAALDAGFRLSRGRSDTAESTLSPYLQLEIETYQAEFWGSFRMPFISENIAT